MDDAVSRRAWVVFTAVSVCSFQTALALSVANVAYPSLRADFPDVSPTALSWVLNLYTIVAGASLVVAGVLVERTGRRRALQLGAGGFALSALGCALAPSFPVLLCFRVCMALASALVTPSSVALIVREFPETRRATAVAGWSAVGSVAAAIGPIVGGVLVDAGGWRWAFLCLVPGGGLGVAMVALFVRESRDPEARPIPDLAGAVLIVAAVGLVIGGLLESRPLGWSDWRVPAAIVAGLAIGAWLVRRSMRHPVPILDVGLFSHRTFTTANVGTFVFGTGFFAVFFGYVLFLTDVWRYDTRTAGLLLTPLAACGAVLAPFAARHVRRHGPGPLLLPGGLLVASGSGWLLIGAGRDPAVWSLWLPALIVVGVGAGLVWPCLFAALVADVPRERYAVATGINQTIQRASTAFGVALAVTLLGPTKDLGGVGTFDRLFVLAAVCGTATAVLSPFMRPAAPPSTGSRLQALAEKGSDS